MGKPEEIYNIEDARQELINAMSALNTYPEGNTQIADEDGDKMYLADAEPMAAHAMEHIKNVFNYLTNVQKISQRKEWKREVLGAPNLGAICSRPAVRVHGGVLKSS